MNKLFLIFLLLGAFSLLTAAQSPAATGSSDSESMARRIAEATPKELPQSPIVKKLTTDSFDDGLKGKVKSVSVSRQSTGTGGEIQMESEEFYDKNGNSLKYIYYDYRGNPGTIDVYGYIDGKRVSQSGSIKYDYNPPPPMARKPAIGDPPAPVADTRYGISYENKYDDKGRLQERYVYGNAGQLYSRTNYVYEINKVTRTSYNSANTVTSIATELLDAQSNVTEVFYPGSNGYGDSSHKYSYEKFDKKGNWTKRIVTGKAGAYGGGQRDFQSTVYRTFTYH